MAIVKKMTKRGFTLIELMIVVVIIGVLAALAIYGVQKYVANSKSAEARMMLGRMSKDMLNFFEGETQASAILGFGGSATISRALCPAAPATFAAPPVAAKALPAATVFSNNVGWQCLGTSITTPIYYSYSTTSDQAGVALSALTNAGAGDAFSAIAQGDLDGDTVTSSFILGGQVIQDAGGNMQLTLATTVAETNPEE